LVAAIIAVISIYSGMKISGYQAEENKYRAFQSELTAAKSAHLTWLRNITTAILTEAEKLNVITDGRECKFGKWYLAEETRNAVNTMPKELQVAFNGIDTDHLEVHDLGRKLMEIWNKDDLKPVIEQVIKDVAPTANSVLDELTKMEQLCDKEVARIQNESEFLLNYQSLPTLVTLIIGVIILLPYTLLTARGIVVPMGQGGAVLGGIVEKGQLHVSIPESILRRKDEIGDLGRGVDAILNDYRHIADISEKLAEGDWQVTVHEKSPDDTLNLSLSKMLDQVNRVLHEINESVKEVATGAGEVSNAAQSLSDGSQSAAASLEEITASMGEISSQTK
jgi:methyl-accepting chemotaxis protein